MDDRQLRQGRGQRPWVAEGTVAARASLWGPTVKWESHSNLLPFGTSSIGLGSSEKCLWGEGILDSEMKTGISLSPSSGKDCSHVYLTST